MSNNIVHISSKEQFDNILDTSRLVVADFYADWCGPCKQIAPAFSRIATQLSRPNQVTFVKIDNDKHTDIVNEYGVTTLPTILLFSDRKVIDTMQGADGRRIQEFASKLASELARLESETKRGAAGSSGSAASSGFWCGAELPRGYTDITDQVEIRGCELLNADEDSGPVKVLFSASKPSALNNGKATSKDWVQSGADDQLLLFIPVISIVKLHTLQLTSLPPQDDDDAPARPGTIHLYINRPQNMDFGEADDTESTQAIELKPEDWNEDGTASISLRYVKFQKMSTLIVYVQEGDGEKETVRLDRVRLIGEAGPKREMGKLQKIGETEE